MGINSLLAREQVALIRARFTTSNTTRAKYRSTALDRGRELQSSLYPHRVLCFEMLT
jgi:hypothetical protein